MSGDDVPGFYGKLPVLGDFVSRRLPREFMEPWDQWLQLVMTKSREQMAGDWLAAYLAGPIWRFALAPHLCGPSAWAGAVMPSVDKVGRYFPLTVAAKHAGNPLAFICGIGDGESWFERVEQTLLSALDGAKDIDQFDGEIQALNTGWPMDNEPVFDMSAMAANDTADWLIPMRSAVARTAADLFAYLLRAHFENPSIWWTKGSERIGPSLLVCQGLPSTARFAGMLDARWRMDPGGTPSGADQSREEAHGQPL